MAGAGVLGGAGGKKKKKKDDGEAKKNLKPGDLPPRRGRAWNPGAGPRPDKDKEGGGKIELNFKDATELNNLLNLLGI